MPDTRINCNVEVYFIDAYNARYIDEAEVNGGGAYYTTLLLKMSD